MQVGQRQRARRRRVGGALFAAGTVVVAAVLVLPGDRPPAPGSGSAPPSSAAPVPSGVEAWLAWMPGGFPAELRSEVDAGAGFDAAVVVAGDTRWLTTSWNADGAVVDRPDPPFAIPIDAFAVDADRYASFLPDDVRDDVVEALRAGKAVLGESSSALRRLGVGGRLAFRDGEVEVGAVVPDAAVGWSEVLVERSVGTGLGIAHDRYLLARGDGLTVPTFRKAVRGLVPPGTPLRIVPPGGTPYVRVASGVNPPVVMKQVFGEFAAAPRTDDPAFFTVPDEWRRANIVTAPVPILGDVTCHRALFPALRGALRELVARGLDGLVSTYSGCYAPRTVARSDTAPPSQHAYGAAIDIDAPANAYGDTTPAMDPRVVEVFERWGFIWGGRFLIPDGMHFEYGSPASR
jgi:hypothetical protein